MSQIYRKLLLLGIFDITSFNIFSFLEFELESNIYIGN